MSLIETAKRTVPAVALSAALAFSPSSAVLAEFPFDSPAGLFLDDAGVVPKASVSTAIKSLAAIRTQQGINVHFIVVKSVPIDSSIDDYAESLFNQWGYGPDDVLILGGTKVARAGVYAGENVSDKLTREIANSIGNETYATYAGQEKYGTAVMEVNNRLIPVLAGEADPGPPIVKNDEVVQTYKTKAETDAQRGKYIKVVVAVLAISLIAPIIQTLWYIR